MKDKFFLTFGQRYRYEPHPSGYNVNPDGWIEVFDYTYNLARQKVIDIFGLEWCFLYHENTFNPKDFPAGKTDEIE